MTSKKGVTLITLVITVVILSLITGAVIVNSFGAINKTKLAKFGESLKIIEDKVEEYYVVNGRLPIIQHKQYTSQEIIGLNTTGNSARLGNEITKNKDEDSNFYEIDFLLIKVNLSTTGHKSTQDDVYVISDKTGKVYYLKGEKVGDEVYFSLANISSVEVVD